MAGSINGYQAIVVPGINHASVSDVDEFCKALGGKRPIHSILIANNGMAAVKFIRSVRTWAYETFGSEKAILLVGMATPEDMRINAEHIRIADQFVEVPGGTNNNNYANVQLIVEMAEVTRVDAVWPGWGHASENPELPDALKAKGILFLGPPAASMAALGDKIGSSLIAQAADVPTLPWSGSHVKIPPDSSLVTIPEEIYRQACVYTTEEAIASCQIVGYPAMIKASWGGGGKGIRKVHNADEVRALFKQVQGEVPGSPIFIMKVASQSRHLEVQLLCDQYGNVSALHSRDCSVQRRHQKIIEEGPITVASPETVKKLEQAARRLAKSVNYVGAATVEYLYSMDTGEYYFLELNPRLQVEHPVTEWIAEINLPAAQVAVGMGIPLWQIPEIRRFYGVEHGGGYDSWKKTSIVASPFDFDKAESIRPKGHCVAVRVTSEDPDDGFKPTSGKVQELSFKSKPNVWAYFSVKSGGGIHEFSDSQFGHVFAFGESRALAIANMVLGLKEIQIRGEIRTNVDYTIDLLHASDYRENKIHTGWLDSRIAMRVRAERPPWYLSVVGGALYKASATSAAVVSDYVGYLEKGQIPPKHISLVHSQVSLNIEGSKYTIDVVRGGSGSYRLRMNNSEVVAEIHTLRDGGLLMQLDGKSHVIYAEEEAAGTRLLIDGRTCLLQNDHDPSKLMAETPCKLLRYLVSDNSSIDADTPYAEVEIMKMCMPLLSPASGVIHFKMSEGQAMQAGELIAKLDLDDPSAVRKAEPFHGSFPRLGLPTAISGKVHQRCAATLNAARMILAGYEHKVDEVVQDLLNCLDSPELPFLQWQECFAVLATRLPKDLRIMLESKYREFESISRNSLTADFPAKLLKGILEAHLSSCDEKERGALERLIEPLMSLAKSYEGGRESHARVIVHSLFEEYLSVEELFNDNMLADVIERMRQQYKKDLLKIVDIVLSHQGIKSKNKLVLRLMEQLVYPNPAAYRDKLIRFSTLNHTNYSELALKASQLLEQTKLSELRSNIARSLSELEMFTEDGENMDTPKRKIAINERMEDLVSASLAVEDALVGLFDHSDHTLQRRVVETYIRRLYQPYVVKESVRMQWHRSGLIASWEFLEEHMERKNIGSDDHETSEKGLVEKRSKRKWGAMVIIKSLQFLPSIISAALTDTNHSDFESAGAPLSGNMMHIAIVGINNQMSLLQDSGDEDQAQERVNKLAKILKEEEVSSSLCSAGVGVISCIIQRDEGRTPMRHSFHWSMEKQYYEEEPLMRHLEPPLSIYLELDKLKGYSNIQYTPSRDRQWHLYTVTDKPVPIKRMFLRSLVRQATMNDGFMLQQGQDKKLSQTLFSMPYTSKCVLRSLMDAMEELELNAHNAAMKPDHAHMFLSILREQQIDDLVPYPRRVEVNAEDEETTVEMILEEAAREIHRSIGVRMHRLGVCEWEVRLWLVSSGLASGAWRVVVANMTGRTCTVHIYREVEATGRNGLIYHSITKKGPLHGTPINAQYKPLGYLDKQRLAARRSNTTYCHDFPLAFETALEQLWASQHPGVKKPCKNTLINVKELVFSNPEGSCTSLIPVERPPGLNEFGMVAWCLEMSTPEFPMGRKLLIVANDVTFKAGSFGPREDAFFLAVTELACAKKLPLIYLAANSGARLGVAEEVKACFKVGWSDEVSPENGFQYIYLSPEDHARIGSSVISHEVKLPSGETRWVIDTIVGKEDGIGVENLTGSGAIAGAYSRAYNETFTLTFVSGRTVGIGAYLARLGMRCIQRLDQPIILTGFSTLNKLLGREVYSSHMQLGGPKIMGTNGVVHLTVSDDLEGVSAILNWLSYIPAYVGGPLPVLAPLDPPERTVEYVPENSCDPRAAIAGINDNTGKWLGGIFDKNSFIETLEGWARTVVTGRAKLGGIPVGVVAVETQTVMQIIPADPGQLDSHERVVPQAGQVWFPDSAAKTAQAVMDFNREELPLFILANWRGFSGGQRDLFEGILQAGSTIVENLRTYRQPVFVYIPKMGELRGGAWVVVDSQINSDYVEMYADETGRGNVLEPEGTIEIKFRTREMLECMGRLDQKLISLKARLQNAKQSEAYANVELLQQQDDTGQGAFSISNPVTQTTQSASPHLSGSFTGFQSFLPVSAPRDERLSRDDKAYGVQMADMSMIDPALTRPAYPPISTFQDTLPRDHGHPNQQQPPNLERYQSSAPITPLSAQSPGLSISSQLQVADEPGSSNSNRSAPLNIESPMSTPPYLGSGRGTPAAESSTMERPAKRTRYDSSLYNSRMLPPLVPSLDPNDEPRNATPAISQVESGTLRRVDVNKIKTIPSRKYSRRLSVSSLLSGPLDGAPSDHQSHGSGWDYRSQDWTPYMHDVYQDTDTWGIDRGLVDLDIGKNDDVNAISESSSTLVGFHQESDVEYGGELSPMEFGFGMESNETALEVGYYDKPVSICIPRILQPLPAKLLENPMNLLYFHHFLDHTAGCLIPHNCSSNPFRSILPQMAVRDDDLLHLLLAYSATHRARLLRQPEPATRIALWVKDIFPNLRHALDDPNKITSNVNLATVIMLASLEIISPKVFGVAVPWQKHLEFARQMLVARGGAHRMQTLSRKDKVSSFLWSWFAYLDVLGSMSGGQNLSSAWMLDYETEDEEYGYQIDCILGFTSRCVRILAKVANLARQCDALRINADSTINVDWQPSNEVVVRAHKLEEDLIESRRHPAKPCTHMQSKSETEYGWDSLEVAATNEAFHSAGLVHLHRRILGKPSIHEDVQHAVGEILGSFSKIRKGSSAEACLLFPMFTAGCDIRDEKQRSDILERMNRVERYGMTQAHKARTLMEKVWELSKPWETLVGGEFFG